MLAPRPVFEDRASLELPIPLLQDVPNPRIVHHTYGTTGAGWTQVDNKIYGQATTVFDWFSASRTPPLSGHSRIAQGCLRGASLTLPHAACAHMHRLCWRVQLVAPSRVQRPRVSQHACCTGPLWAQRPTVNSVYTVKLRSRTTRATSLQRRARPASCTKLSARAAVTCSLALRLATGASRRTVPAGSRRRFLAYGTLTLAPTS